MGLMLMAIGATFFVLIVAFLMYYYSMVLLNALWNSKGFRKLRKDVAESLIKIEKFLLDMEDKYGDVSDSR